MESKCFVRCIRKPGNQLEKSEEVKRTELELKKANLSLLLLLLLPIDLLG